MANWLSLDDKYEIRVTRQFKLPDYKYHYALRDKVSQIRYACGLLKSDKYADAIREAFKKLSGVGNV